MATFKNVHGMFLCNMAILAFSYYQFMLNFILISFFFLPCLTPFLLIFFPYCLRFTLSEHFYSTISIPSIISKFCSTYFSCYAKVCNKCCPKQFHTHAYCMVLLNTTSLPTSLTADITCVFTYVDTNQKPHKTFLQSLIHVITLEN